MSQSSLEGDDKEPLLVSGGKDEHGDSDDDNMVDAFSPAEEQSLINNDALARRNSRARGQTDAERRELMAELKYGVNSVLSLIKPVSVTMLIVIGTIRSVKYYQQANTGDQQQLAYAPMHESDDESTGSRLGGALINVLIILCLIIVMTFVLVICYKKRCYKAIHGWLIISSLFLLFIFSYLYILELLDAHNTPFDDLTLYLVVWNFGVGGMFAIHWKGPLILQQMYLVIISALMALVLIKFLPDWTIMMLLAVIAVYDLFAVLCPGGPLRMLVETAQERDEPLFPALIYSSAMAWTTFSMADKDGTRGGDTDSADIGAFARSEGVANPAFDNASTNATTAARPPAHEAEDEEGVKLGLGDFIFYSVLVGKAATSDDYGTIFSCYVAIIVGLVCTLHILSVYQKALPALPISIFFGLVFFFTTNQVLTPYITTLSSEMVIM
eukprot:m.932266 g.932266  ORF g.932266 m.932266 type:complete len:441 (+) comp23787_c1_seq12:151-1473(+)